MSNWRNTSDYRKWRNECIRLAEGRCEMTGIQTSLHVHHIEHSSYSPELRFEVSNGFVLHRSLHYFFHYALMSGTRKKCTRADLDRYVRFFKFIRKANKLI